MTPEERKIVDRKLKEVAEILYNNTSDEELNNPLNVSQMLKLRCAYLNQNISLGICA